MKATSLSDKKLTLGRKFNNALTSRYVKPGAHRRSLKKGMFVENALLRESRKLSHARNKYTTSMMDNASAAQLYVKTRKSQIDMMNKEKKYGVLTPVSTWRFEHTEFSNPESIDPRLKTLTAAGMATSSELQLINKEPGVHHRMFLRTEMKRPETKLLHTMDTNNLTYRAIQNITQNLSKLNDHSRSNWSQLDMSKPLF